MQSKCPKCNKSIKSKDSDLLSLSFLFSDASLRKNKKAKCDLCGSRLGRK